MILYEMKEKTGIMGMFSRNEVGKLWNCVKCQQNPAWCCWSKFGKRKCESGCRANL